MFNDAQLLDVPPDSFPPPINSTSFLRNHTSVPLTPHQHPKLTGLISDPNQPFAFYHHPTSPPPIPSAVLQPPLFLIPIVTSWQPPSSHKNLQGRPFASSITANAHPLIYLHYQWPSPLMLYHHLLIPTICWYLPSATSSSMVPFTWEKHQGISPPLVPPPGGMRHITSARLFISPFNLNSFTESKCGGLWSHLDL